MTRRIGSRQRQPECVKEIVAGQRLIRRIPRPIFFHAGPRHGRWHFMQYGNMQVSPYFSSRHRSECRLNWLIDHSAVNEINDPAFDTTSPFYEHVSGVSSTQQSPGSDAQPPSGRHFTFRHPSLASILAILVHLCYCCLPGPDVLLRLPRSFNNHSLQRLTARTG